MDTWLVDTWHAHQTLIIAIGVVLLALAHRQILWLCGVIVIPNDSIGAVTKKFAVFGAHRNLPDGSILCTYGWRQPDFGIRAVISKDGGESWDIERTIRIRGGLPNRDLGYPCTVMATDGSLFTIYYGQEADGVTCIMATRWRL